MVVDSIAAKRRPMKSELRILGRGASPMRSVNQRGAVSVDWSAQEDVREEMVKSVSERPSPAFPRRGRPSLKHELLILDRPVNPMRSLAVERFSEETKQSLADRARARMLLQRRMVAPLMIIPRSMAICKPETPIRLMRAPERATLKAELRFSDQLTAAQERPCVHSDDLPEASAELASDRATPAIDEIATRKRVAISKPVPALGEIASSLETSPVHMSDKADTLERPPVTEPSAPELESGSILAAKSSGDMTASSVQSRTEPTVSGVKPSAPVKRQSSWLARLFGGSR